jgi:hypothetical protein
VLATLRGLDLKGEGNAARGPRAEVVGHFAGPAHRMGYPAYAAKGRRIGPGPAGGACRTGGVRMKGGGVRWGEGGADAGAHLRAPFRGEEGQREGPWSQN